jgi:predicted kinase
MTTDRNQAATAHLLHGFVGAGKTTFARKLEMELPAIRFTHDAWMNRLYGPNPPAADFAERACRVDQLIWSCARRALELGTDVILDSGFWTRKSRDEARNRIRAGGFRWVLYSVEVPEHLARERVAVRTRRLPDDSLWINDEAFELFKSRFETLQSDEARTRIDGTSGRAPDNDR